MVINREVSQLWVVRHMHGTGLRKAQGQCMQVRHLADMKVSLLILWRCISVIPEKDFQAGEHLDKLVDGQLAIHHAQLSEAGKDHEIAS